MLQQFGVSQIIKNPTHYGPAKDSIIDVIFTNSSCISKAGVGDVNLSDHEIVFCIRKKINTKRNSINFRGRSYRNYDKDLLVQNCLECDWTLILISYGISTITTSGVF